MKCTPTRVALVHRRFTTHGGTERYLVGLARWLVARGHDVDVLCNFVRPDLRGEPGVRFVHLPMFPKGALPKLLTLWWSARSALSKRSYDVVMGFGRTPGHQLFRAGGGSHLAALRALHPIRRHLSVTDRVEVAIDRHAVESAAIVIANSHFCAKDLVNDYRPKRVEVVYNGVDLRRFRPDPAKREAVRKERGAKGPVAVFLGTGYRRKGLDVAMAALPPGWRLWVAGADRPARVPPGVELLGPLLEPEHFLQAADVMILPTRYDPFANTVLEAMACGIPALTTPETGAAELLPEPWMVQRDAAGFREALLRCEAGDGSRGERNLGERCRQVAEQHAPETSYARAFHLLQEAAR